METSRYQTQKMIENFVGRQEGLSRVLSNVSAKYEDYVLSFCSIAGSPDEVN